MKFNEVMAQRISGFLSLSHFLYTHKQQIDKIAQNIEKENEWFEKEQIKRAITGILYYLREDHLRQWVKYNQVILKSIPSSLDIKIIMAGNIPLVNFHDVFCTLMCGHRAIIKTSHLDKKLWKYLTIVLSLVAPQLSNLISFSDTNNNLKIDALIATGSNITAAYLNYYYKDIPKIIRAHRSSVAVLSGREDQKTLHLLYDDIMAYYGLGCRSVKKIFLPKNYSLIHFKNSMKKIQKQFLLIPKYYNNYLYNKSIFEIEKARYTDFDNFLLQENGLLHPPISVVYYEFYESVEILRELLCSYQNEIQCVYSQNDGWGYGQKIGKSQLPSLLDYPDHINTITFLQKISHTIDRKNN